MVKTAKAEGPGIMQVLKDAGIFERVGTGQDTRVLDFLANVL